MSFIKQAPTPLSDLFFSSFNLDLLQRALRQVVMNKTGVAIDYQNPDDLRVLMRSVYLMNMSQPYDRVQEQVRFMNQKVNDVAVPQIYTNLSQYMDYVRQLGRQPDLIDLPSNTSLYGKKLGV